MSHDVVVAGVNSCNDTSVLKDSGAHIRIVSAKTPKTTQRLGFAGLWLRGDGQFLFHKRHPTAIAILTPYGGNDAAANITANEASGGPAQDRLPSSLESGEQRQASPSPELEDRPPPLPSRPQSSEISTHSVGRTLGRVILFHIPAVAFTVSLLVVYILQLSWNPTANHVAGLLVGAKVHETLIIASLFDMFYYHVRRALISDRGVPFGYLTTAFRLNSPFHFFTGQFWAPITSAWPIGILLIISFLLAFLAGPSSSVLVIPKPGWWPHPDSIGRIWSTQGGSVPGLTGFVVPMSGDLSPETIMYPSSIGHTSVPSRCHDSQVTNSSEIYRRDCPYDDFLNPEQGIYSWLWGGTQSFGITNVTLSNSDERSAILHDELIGDHLAVATAPLARVHKLLTRSAFSWSLSRGEEAVMIKPKVVNKKKESTPLKQPRVVVQCADTPIFPAYTNSDKTKGSYDFLFTTTYYPGFKITLDRPVFADALETGASFGFQDLNEELKRVSVSASVAIWIRANPRDESLGLCIVDARWVAADIWINTNPGPAIAYTPVQQSADITRNETLDYRRQPQDAMVILEPVWCDLLNASFVDSSSSSSTRNTNINYAYNEIARAATASNSPGDSKRGYPSFTMSVARAMAVYLANAMSYTPLSRSWQVEWSRNGPWKPDPNYANPDPGSASGFSFNVVDDLAAYNLITAEYLVSGSGYTFRDIATFLAWGVLLAHLAMALVHFVVVLALKGWYTRVAGSLGELMALAVESLPSGLGYTDGDSGLWKARAYVRDAGPSNGVDIILQDFVDKKGKGKGVDNLG